jgi:hypothetical protein
LQIVVTEVAQRDHATVNIVLMDQGRCHPAHSRILPDTVAGLCMPPSSPELNPSERLWREMNEQGAWLLAGQIAALSQHGERRIRPYSKNAMQSLTADAYVVQAVHALSS